MNEQSRPLSLSGYERPPRSPLALLRVAPVVVLLLLFCCCVSVQATKCSRQTPVYNYDLNRYMGLWYVNRKSLDMGDVSGYFERCHKEIYTILDNGLVDVGITGVNLLGMPFSRNFKSKLANPSKQVALFTVRPNSIFPLDPNSVTMSNFKILDTDYESYSVVIGCTSFMGMGNVQGIWIMTREPNPPPSVVERALHVVRNRKLSEYTLRIVDQKRC